MGLDKVLIGNRIRKIREDIFEESRAEFGKKCNLTERHIGQIERGDFLISLPALDKIVSVTGINVDFILYGKDEKNSSISKENLINFIKKADNEEIKMYYKCISSIKSYVIKRDENLK